MKITKITMFFNRQIDDTTMVNILTNEDKKEGEIDIQFRSIEAYKQFMRDPKIKEKWMDLFDLALFKQEHLNIWVEKGNFKEMVKTAKIKYEVQEDKKFNEAILRNNIPVIIDISRLSFKKKMEIITHPLATDKIKFLDKYTEDEELSLKEISEMYQYLLNIAQKIKSKNYTQLESIYYIYNELKNKIYNEEEKHESYHKSRSLNQIINNDKIVCAGYSNYFLAISDMLDLKVEETIWDPMEGHKCGHSSLIAYVNDPKYNAHGIWGIDTTWDSKKFEEDKNYKLNLSHFLMPLVIDEMDKERHFLTNPHNNSFYIIDEAMNRYHKLETLFAPEIVLNNSKKNIIKKFNHIYRLLGLDEIDITYNIEEEYERLLSYKKKYLSILEMDKLINYVTPKNPDDAIRAMKTTCSYKCMSEDSRSIYRLVRSLK